MKTSLLTWGTALALSFGSFFTPSVDAAKDCSTGSGFYSCDFKDEAKAVSQGSLLLSFNNFNAVFQVSNGAGLSAFGDCNCQLQGTTKDNNKPLKDNTSIICASSSTPLTTLVGKISGNPNKPETLKVKGQVHQFLQNSNATGVQPVGYLFDCKEASQSGLQ
jgi:hypothetical protein